MKLLQSEAEIKEAAYPLRVLDAEKNKNPTEPPVSRSRKNPTELSASHAKKSPTGLSASHCKKSPTSSSVIDSKSCSMTGDFLEMSASKQKNPPSEDNLEISTPKRANPPSEDNLEISTPKRANPPSEDSLEISTPKRANPPSEDSLEISTPKQDSARTEISTPKQENTYEKMPSPKLVNTCRSEDEVIFDHKTAFARYEEIRLYALAKEQYNVARAVVKNQCELFNLVGVSPSVNGELTSAQALEHEFERILAMPCAEDEGSKKSKNKEDVHTKNMKTNHN